MNIVLYVNSFLPRIGGRELVVYHLAIALKQLGHRVRVVGPAGWLSDSRYEFQFKLHRYPVLDFNRLRRKSRDGAGSQSRRYQGAPCILQEQFALCQLFLDTALWGCDVIHAHNTFPTGYRAARLKRIRNIPLVITPHGEDIHVVPEIDFGLRLNPALQPKIRYALENADAITAISGSIEKSLYDAGAPADRVVGVPNGVDLERFDHSVSVDVHEWLGIPSDAQLIVTIGNYHPRKGHEFLVRSMPLISEKHPRARLAIIGRNTDSIKQLAHQLGLDGRVIFTGPLPVPTSKQAAAGSADRNPDRLAAILQSALIYVSAGTSEGAEGLSLAVLEAMAASLPVVATDISGNRDVVRNGETGFLVPPAEPEALANAITELLTNYDARNRMAKTARDTARCFEWREIARQYVEVYEEVERRCAKPR